MKIDISDYITITENDVLEITLEGIKYTGGFIDFLECAANFKEEHGGSGKCVVNVTLQVLIHPLGFILLH